MPEVPEASVYHRRLEEGALSREIAHVTIVDPIILADGLTPARLSSLLEGRQFLDTHRHGKHVFARYGDESGWLALHFGMTGNLRVLEDGEAPEYAYGQVHFSDGGQLAFICPRKFARIRVVDAPSAFIESRDLGPDVRRADVDTFVRQFEGRRGAIKGRLLDQSVVAGLGNIYADEALYQEKIHPRTGVPELTGDDLRGLYHAIQEVVEAAIDVGGKPTALDPDTFMLPHRYGDERCPNTGVALEKETVSGRTAYFSPAHQPPPE